MGKMKPLRCIMAMTLLTLTATGQVSSFWGFEQDARQAWDGQLWIENLENFSAEAYTVSTHKLLELFERETSRRLVPGARGRVALKVYTNSGAGLATPQQLVRAVIEFLLQRGFERDAILIVDARESFLREAGYLPPLSRMPLQGPTFAGVEVASLDSGVQRSETWFYESPLPREFSSPLGQVLLGQSLELNPELARKSYLPVSLVAEVDFWINLPVAAHHPAVGLSGALVNATLWNITNGSRFFSSPANAPVAVAEIGSIPELKASWALNLVSLEQYQFIAGPAFNANYTRSLPQLWMSADPVVIDARLIQLVNIARKENGFKELPMVPEFIEYSMQLGLGNGFPVSKPLPQSPKAALDD